MCLNQQPEEAIAARYQLDSDRILTANGSDELIDSSSCLFRGGDEAIHTQYGFGFPTTQLLQEACLLCPIDGLTASVDDILKVVREDKLSLQPNNPTGTLISEERLGDYMPHCRHM